jgi:hypothetical protein
MPISHNLFGYPGVISQCQCRLSDDSGLALSSNEDDDEPCEQITRKYMLRYIVVRYLTKVTTNIAFTCHDVKFTDST